MNIDDVAIATVTLVREPAEEALLRRAVTLLSALGASVHVADGGSPGAFIEFLRSLPNVHLAPPHGRGLVAQVQASLASAMASRRAAILYTESDKELFFRTDALSLIDSAVPGDMTIAARTLAAFATYPPLQQFTERTINQLTGESVQVAGDYSYGPFLLPADVAPRFAGIPSELGWGWRHFIFAVAYRLGRRLSLCEGDYACPTDQRLEDPAERLHRLRQLSQNVNGLVAGLTTTL